MGKYPYMNRGSYSWVPDTYAATTGADFGVTQAYYPSRIDFGRPQNALPPDLGGWAAETLIYGTALRSGDGTALNSLGDVEGGVIGGPFLRSLMRTLSPILENLPEGDPVGMSSFDQVGGKTPYYLFTTDKIGRGNVASILIDYVLHTSEAFHENGSQSDTPLSIIALFNLDEVGAWYVLSRSGDQTQWGPPKEEPQVVSSLMQVAADKLQMPVVGLHIPIPWRDAGDRTRAISIPELNVTDPAAYDATVVSPAQQPWGADNYRSISIRLCPTYFTSSANFSPPWA